MVRVVGEGLPIGQFWNNVPGIGPHKQLLPPLKRRIAAAAHGEKVGSVATSPEAKGASV